jgi:exodeoxyribonuclease VII small subunit
MAKKAAKQSPKDFGSARQRLDEILAELEQDGGDVDRLAERIKEASVLIRFCRERLSSARAEVRSVVAELDADQAADSRPTPSADSGSTPVDEDRAPPQEPPPEVSEQSEPDGPLGADALGDGSLPF